MNRLDLRAVRHNKEALPLETMNKTSDYDDSKVTVVPFGMATNDYAKINPYVPTINKKQPTKAK